MKTNLFQKISIVFLFVSLITAKSFSQGAYVNLGLGYNLPAGTQVIGVNSTSSLDQNVYGSYGKGLSFGGIIGYMFTEHVGAELGLSYLIGSEYEITQTDNNTSEISKRSGKMFRITPALKVEAGGNISPYAKFGLVLGLGAKREDAETGSFGGDSFIGSDKFSGGTATGWMGAFGIDFKINEKVSIFAELNTINQTWAPDKDEWTAVVTNKGVSVSESATTTYGDNLSYPVSKSAVFKYPLQDLKSYLSFSSFGIGAGIKINLGK